MSIEEEVGYIPDLKDKIKRLEYDNEELKKQVEDLEKENAYLERKVTSYNSSWKMEE